MTLMKFPIPIILRQHISHENTGMRFLTLLYFIIIFCLFVALIFIRHIFR